MCSSKKIHQTSNRIIKLKHDKRFATAGASNVMGMDYGGAFRPSDVSVTGGTMPEMQAMWGMRSQDPLTVQQMAVSFQANVTSSSYVLSLFTEGEKIYLNYRRGTFLVRGFPHRS